MSTLTKTPELHQDQPAKKPVERRRQIHTTLREASYLRLKHIHDRDSIKVGDILSDLIDEKYPKVEVAA